MNSFNAKANWTVDGQTYTIFRLAAVADRGHNLRRLPFSLRVLLENLLRNQETGTVADEDIEALATWDPKADPSKEIAFTPARTLLQDFTGVPCVVDLAAMRDAMAELGGDPQKINPLNPVELVIDHSVQVDQYGTEAAILINRDLEFERNEERYKFLKWGQNALHNFKAVPPNTGIVHQVNIEYLARVVMTDGTPGYAYPDTLVGTDSHTTMVNGLGVLGWGVGGIEAEAAMLGQPVSMLIPHVIGFKLTGTLREGTTATDLVLVVTEMLRNKGVVGKFVEFFGAGLTGLPVADRATIANMAPEYGATMGFFPVDEETIKYLRMTGRPEEHVKMVEAYCKEQGLWHNTADGEPEYTDVLSLDLGTVVPSVAGPKRPQDRLALQDAGPAFKKTFEPVMAGRSTKMPLPMAGAATAVLEKPEDEANAVAGDLRDGAVVIAAITSCTNTSNPSVMVAAGLLAKKAVEKGLDVKPWVKTSLAPGSRVVTNYLTDSGLLPYLEKLNFFTVGYGCTTCIGNSGPLPEEISKAINEKNLVAVSVLSGNRNFEGRVHADVKANYLMSPPLVVAYALVGTIDIDLTQDSLGKDKDGNDVFLRDIWPSQHEIAETIHKCGMTDMFRKNYADVFKGDEKWNALDAGSSDRYGWDPKSTYIKRAPYFDGMPKTAPDVVADLNAMKVLAILGDSITTDHISPAGSIKGSSPAGLYLEEHGIEKRLFNSYGSRRGNHEVMVRGTFANIRLKNQLAPGTEGEWTTYLPTGEVMSIFDASEKYQEDGVGLIVLAGKEYGTGSSRDWAAKGPYLLGIKCVIAESFERIHRSNLVGMGILPLQFEAGDSIASLGLTGQEEFSVLGLSDGIAHHFHESKLLDVRATDERGMVKTFRALARIDTPQECQYYRHGGILQYVLRQLLKD
ncbi:MAG: aconitate hydratase AcnA [Fimbriimonadaceae bacterium]|nr:aconitate hydratase AcnA [Fimbriimonadaceae bacterium]